jgi:hypothetical protein
MDGSRAPRGWHSSEDPGLEKNGKNLPVSGADCNSERGTPFQGWSTPEATNAASTDNWAQSPRRWGHLLHVQPSQAWKTTRSGPVVVVNPFLSVEVIRELLP